MAMFSSLYMNIGMYIMLRSIDIRVRTRTMHLAILAASMSSAASMAALLVASSGAGAGTGTVVWRLGPFSRYKNGASSASSVGTLLSAQA